MCILECLVGRMDPKRGHICTMLPLFWRPQMVASCHRRPKALCRGPSVLLGDGLHDRQGRQTKPSLPQVLVSLFDPPPPSAPPKQRLLLGHRKWFLDLDFAAIVDDDVFEGLVARVGRCPLDFLNHILEDKEDTGG